MPIDVRGALPVWSPRGGVSRFRNWPHAPQITHYVPPPPLPQPKKTLTALDAQSSADLLAQTDRWMQEADALEKRDTREEGGSVEERIARLMFKTDIPLKMKEMQRNWDPRADGTITKGEFRNYLKEIGLKASMNEMDVLFDKWDRDDSGSIDMYELEKSMRQLHEDFVRKRGERGLKPEVRMQVDALRTRAKWAKEAAESARLAEACAEELRELTFQIESRLDVQLGRLMVTRGIKVGEVVGQWPKTKVAKPGEPRRGLNELSKKEFRDEVTRLGLVVNKRPATPAELNRLFDQIDTDHSGYLDIKEAKAALKKWAEFGKEAYADKAAKEKQLLHLKTRAARKLQDALRPPAQRSPRQEDLDAAEKEVHDAPPAAQMSYRGRLSHRLSVLAGRDDKRKDEARKQKIKDDTMRAFQFMRQHELTRAWVSWKMRVEERWWARQTMSSTLAGLKNLVLVKGFKTWHDRHDETLRVVKILLSAKSRVASLELLRGWNTWVDVVAASDPSSRQEVKLAAEQQRLTADQNQLEDEEADDEDIDAATKLCTAVAACVGCTGVGAAAYAAVGAL